MRKILIAAGVLAVFGVAGAAVLADPPSVTDAKNAFPKTTRTQDCGNGDYISIYGARKLWPPNHKYRTETVTVHEDHPMTYSWNATATSSEGELDPGSGHTVADIAPPAWMGMDMGPKSSTQDFLVRAERDGGGSGRTYTIDVQAKFDGGSKSCEGKFDITVPHDMRGGMSSQ